MKINLQKLASTLQAYKNCIASNNTEWKAKHMDTIETMCKDLPIGSGIDSGTQFDHENSNPAKLIFNTSFHHMDNSGGYDGWSEHKVIITPSFGSFEMNITGKNRNDIKEYLSQVFHDVFSANPMNTVCVKLPKIEEVDFTIETLDEDVNPKEQLDNEEEANRIIEEHDNGNIWAWCTVKVTATHGDSEGTDYLGCCSYKDENGFKEGGYYEDMKQAAYNDLINALQDLEQ